MAEQTPDEVKFPNPIPGSRWAFRLFMFLASRYKIIGREHFPTTQFLLTVNHLSYMDVPAIGAALKGKVAGFAAKKYKGTLLELFFRMGSPVWIEQDSPDRQALSMALKLIKQGYNFGVAPEGHRSRTGGLIQGREGAAFLATRANLPILPMVVWGSEKLLRRPRPKVTVVIGKPYRLPEGRVRGDLLAEYTDRIMCALAALLPEKYRGYYAGHPLIAEMAPLVRPDGL